MTLGPPHPSDLDDPEKLAAADPSDFLKTVEGLPGQLAEAYADGKLDWLDGLTVDYPEWWFNARPSNTEPLLRLNVEATTAELGEARTAELIARISAR